MTTRSRLDKAFLAWNVKKEGIGKLTAGNWSYNNDVLYYQGQPYKRFIHDRHGNSVQLIKVNAKDLMYQDAVQSAAQKTNGGFSTWSVPEIGALSRHAADVLPVLDYHERMKRVLMLEVQCIPEERLRHASAATYEVWSAGAKGTAHNKMESTFTRLMDSHYSRWLNWSAVFDLGWSPISEIFYRQVLDEVQRKVKTYYSAEEMAKRIRKRARAEAKTALGLDD